MNDTTPGMPPLPPEPAEGSGAAPTPAAPALSGARTMRSSAAIVLSLAMLVVGAVGGYVIGNSGSGGSSGPKSLADALAQYRDGKLPQGDVQGGFGGGFANGNGNGNGGGQGLGRLGGGAGARFGVIGQIKSINGDVVTVTTGRGGDVKVTVTPSTTIQKTVEGTKSDLKSGMNVRVTPTNNTSGNSSSVTARAITEVPAGQLRGRPGAAPAASAGQ